MEDTPFRQHTSVNWGPGKTYGTVQYGDDSNLLVMFYTKDVENAAKSQQAGRPIFENQVYVKIQHPGEPYNVIDRPATDHDKQRFAGTWNKFLMNRSQIPEGTPIGLLFPNNPAFAANLRGQGVYTIEQCANLSGHAIENIGRGAQEVVNRAKKYLESATKGLNFHQWQKKEEEWQQKFRIQQQQIEQLQNQLNAYLQSQHGPNPNQGYIPGYDPQTERINANHPTGHLRKLKPKSGPLNVGADTAAVLPIDAIPSEPGADVSTYFEVSEASEPNAP